MSATALAGRLTNKQFSNNCPVLYNALPFSTLDVSVQRVPKGHLRSSKHYPSNPQTVGQHLLKVRLDRMLTQKAVAKQIGVSPATITTWEQEKNTPEVMQMKGIIAFLGYYPLSEPSTLAGQIRKYRNVNGLTLEEFGKLLGVDGATVWTWENGKYVPLPETIQKIEKVLQSSC